MKRCSQILTFLIALLILTSTKIYAKECITYSHLTDNYWQIWMMDADGKNKRQITFSGSDKRGPIWVADTESILFRTNNGRLLGVTLSESSIEKTFLPDIPNINNPNYSRPTNTLVFASFCSRPVDSSEIWKTNLTEPSPHLLTSDKILKYQPAISADGKKIVFVKSDRTTPSAHNLWLMDGEGGGQKQLTFWQRHQTLPHFSPDQAEIIFSSNSHDANYEIYVISLSSDEIRRLTTNKSLDTGPCYSPDGSKIVFVSNRGGSQQLWIMNGDGTNPRQITFDDTESIDPAWISIQE